MNYDAGSLWYRTSKYWFIQPFLTMWPALWTMKQFRQNLLLIYSKCKYYYTNFWAFVYIWADFIWIRSTKFWEGCLIKNCSSKFSSHSLGLSNYHIGDTIWFLWGGGEAELEFILKTRFVFDFHQKIVIFYPHTAIKIKWLLPKEWSMGLLQQLGMRVRRCRLGIKYSLDWSQCQSGCNPKPSFVSYRWPIISKHACTTSDRIPTFNSMSVLFRNTSRPMQNRRIPKVAVVAKLHHSWGMTASGMSVH